MCECVLREDGYGIIRDFYCRRSKIVSLNQRIVKLKMRIKSNLLLYHDYMKMECMYFKSTDSAFLFAYKLWVCLSLKVYCSLIKCLFDLLSSSCILWKQIVYIYVCVSYNVFFKQPTFICINCTQNGFTH